MDKLKKIKYYIDSLCIYDLKNDSVIRAIYNLANSVDSEAILTGQSEFFRIVAKNNSLKEYISRCILTDDNPFTRAACAGSVDKLEKSVIDAVKLDLMKLEEISSLTADDLAHFVTDEDLKEILKTIPAWETGKPLAPLTVNWGEQIQELIAYHRTNGYGEYAKHIAFTWRNKEICPVTSADLITLADLKNYEEQRRKVIDNTESFIAGQPANNVLLYGDRGTGKSSTVHALLNEYHNQGLRMIEIPKSAVADLGLIREKIAKSPMKFIIYIDDLSFDSNDTSFSELKAALEGSLSGRQSNILIYATSNRRHLIKENFTDRENDVTRGDTMQEQLSLSDRFGLTITFLNPDKKNYLDIVEKIAVDRGLTKIDREHLLFEAERWAIRRGGRSPRCAKQFVDYVQSCENRGKEW
ncbi:MAG TPA: ATP-binding protein [Candidatus Eubacterium faecigallinarum]|nr:ATP-binding protein [Candidatus Eubacterium faecigallinarum]